MHQISDRKTARGTSSRIWALNISSYSVPFRKKATFWRIWVLAHGSWYAKCWSRKLQQDVYIIAVTGWYCITGTLNYPKQPNCTSRTFMRDVLTLRLLIVGLWQKVLEQLSQILFWFCFEFHPEEKGTVDTWIHSASRVCGVLSTGPQAGSRIFPP